MTLNKDNKLKEVKNEGMFKKVKHRGKIGLLAGVLATLLFTHKGCVLNNCGKKVKLENPDDFKNKMYTIQIEQSKPFQIEFCDICKDKKVEKVVEQKIVYKEPIKEKIIYETVPAKPSPVEKKEETKLVEITKKVVNIFNNPTEKEKPEREERPRPERKEKPRPERKEKPLKPCPPIITPEKDLKPIEIILPPKEESKEPILEEILHENDDAVKKVEGYQRGAQDASINGYEDGVLNKPYNDNPRIDLSGYDSIYVENYILGYKEYYGPQFYKGEKLAEGPINRTEETILEPGFSEENGKIYDENGYEVYFEEDFNVNEDLKALETLRDALSNSEKTQDSQEYENYSNDETYEEERKTNASKETTPETGFYEKDGVLYDENDFEVILEKDFDPSQYQDINNESNYQSSKDTFEENIEPKIIRETTPEADFYEENGVLYDENDNEVYFDTKANVNDDIAALQEFRETVLGITSNSKSTDYAKVRSI